MLQCDLPTYSSRSSLADETMQFDVVIVGAGPAGLSAACRLAQRATESGRELSIAVIEKAAAVGGHILSGAVIDTRALDELFPQWQEEGAPTTTEVVDDPLHWLVDAARSFRVPRWLVPRTMHNRGNRIVSLGQLCRWLAARAEGLGCDVLTGFAAVDCLYDANGRVAGVITGDRGIGADGTPKTNAETGYTLRACSVLVAEGCRGSLSERLEARFELRKAIDPQHYGLLSQLGGHAHPLPA
jgi:electron-transferring-flavoprotein dehydrogenase